ncbi:hypothetical protein Tco_0878175 [Tanacetum coccineum]|uniref:Retrotransposon gag domain-containing protein n=1 Tax=Tanacetum coccineum TaxID=301880 RepID=A0ABQ5C2I3_9ASTR
MALGGVVTNLPPSTTVDAENWITHIEKLFEVLRCVDEFKARLASYKLEGDALNWSEQQKYEREYHMTRQRDRETNGELRKRFLRLAGFVGKKEGPPEERAKHFKWALYDWILDGIVNTEFTDVAQVASAARNMEILLMIDRVEIVIRSHGRTEVSSTTVLLGLQVRKDTRMMPPLLHVTYVGNFFRARHVIGLLELISFVIRLGMWPWIA